MMMDEIRKMSDEELAKKETELREDVFRMKFKMASGELEDTSAIRNAKKDIARIKTVLTERQKVEG